MTEPEVEPPAFVPWWNGKQRASEKNSTVGRWPNWSTLKRSTGLVLRWTLPAPHPPLGGEDTGPNPTDRGKRSCKHHLLVDCNGLPVAVVLSGANIHDDQRFIPFISAIPPASGKRDRPPPARRAKLHAEEGCDYPFCRAYLRRRGIVPRIARRVSNQGSDSDAIAGWLRETVPGSIASVVCVPATTDGQPSISHSCASPAPSSTIERYDGSSGGCKSVLFFVAHHSSVFRSKLKYIGGI